MEDKQAVTRAAARAAAHALEAQRQAEIDERTRKEEARQNLPLVSPKTNQSTGRTAADAKGDRSAAGPNRLNTGHFNQSNYVEAQREPTRQRQARTLPRVSAVPADYHEKMDRDFEEGPEDFDVSLSQAEASGNSYGLTVTAVSTILSLLLIGLVWFKEILAYGPRVAMTLTMAALFIILFRIAFMGRKRKAERLASYFFSTVFLAVNLFIAYVIIKSFLF